MIERNFTFARLCKNPAQSWVVKGKHIMLGWFGLIKMLKKNMGNKIRKKRKRVCSVKYWIWPSNTH